MSQELTTEEKRKRLLAIAEGRPVAEVIGPIGHSYIWLYDEDTKLYEGKGPAGEMKLTEDQLEAYDKKNPGVIQIVIRLCPAEGCEPMQPLSYSKPEQDQIIHEPKAIPETITQDVQAEITGQAKEPETIPGNDNVIVIGSVKPEQRIKVNFEEIDWQDVPDESKIDFMFPARR